MTWKNTLKKKIMSSTQFGFLLEKLEEHIDEQIAIRGEDPQLSVLSLKDVNALNNYIQRLYNTTDIETDYDEIIYRLRHYSFLNTDFDAEALYEALLEDIEKALEFRAKNQ